MFNQDLTSEVISTPKLSGEGRTTATHDWGTELQTAAVPPSAAAPGSAALVCTPHELLLPFAGFRDDALQHGCHRGHTSMAVFHNTARLTCM
jgi:hypothetical protein